MTLLNRILSALLALALLVGGLLAAAEIVLAQLGQPSWLVPHEQWSSWLREQTWDAAVVRIVLVGVVVLGLLLLLPALRRGKPSTVDLPARGSGSTNTRVSASRRGVEKTLAAAARRVEGISSASADVGRRTVRIKARTATRSKPDLQRQLTAAVATRIDDLGLSDTLRPRVTISREGR